MTTRKQVIDELDDRVRRLASDLMAMSMSASLRTPDPRNNAFRESLHMVMDAFELDDAFAIGEADDDEATGEPNDPESALDIAIRYGGIDGAHHKDWVIDQMVRALTGDDYERVISEACDGEDGPDTYTWNVGIAP